MYIKYKLIQDILFILLLVMYHSVMYKHFIVVLGATFTF